MEYIKYSAIFSFLLLCFAVFTSLSQEVVAETDGEIQAIAEPLLDNLLDAFKENDYSKYSRDLDDSLKSIVSEKKFIEADKRTEAIFGNCQLRKYLGFLKKSNMTVVLWKAKFDKVEDDILIKLAMLKKGGRYLITGLWFQ